MKRLFISLFIFAFSVSIFAANDSIATAPAAPAQTGFIYHIENWYKHNTNYFSITLLMSAESSILPVPSELVIPPAVFVAMEPDSGLSIWLIILFGTFGAWVGASFNYVMSRSLGRFVIYKFADSRAGRLFLLSSEKIQKAETFFNKHGKTSTFIGRLIPVIRHLISIPAGLSKMNYLTFSFYTVAGAGIWNCILALLGYLAHGQQDIIYKYSQQFSIGFLVIGVVLLIWLIIRSQKNKKKKVGNKTSSSMETEL